MPTSSSHRRGRAWLRNLVLPLGIAHISVLSIASRTRPPRRPAHLEEARLTAQSAEATALPPGRAGDNLMTADAPIYGAPASARQAEERAWSRLALWLRAHAVALAPALTVACALGVVHAWGLDRYPALFDDEGTYVSQAYAVDNLHSLAPYTYWYDHPPLGWIQLAAWERLVPAFGSDPLAIVRARQFILVAFIASTLLLYVVARRLGIRPSLAVLTTLLFGLSPLALHYQRMVLLDNIAVFWLLAAYALALTPERRLRAYPAAGLCLACAALTKETFLLFLPAIALAVFQRAAGPTRRFALMMFVTVFALAGVFYPLFALLRGELFRGSGHVSLMYGVTFQLGRGGGSVFHAGSGSRQLVDGWLHLDPLLLALGIASVPLLLAVRRYRTVGLGLLVPVAMLLRPDPYIPAMYIIGMMPFAALAIAAVCELLAVRLTGWADRIPRLGRLSSVVAVAVVIAVPSALAAPRWATGDWHQVRTDDVSASRQALDWLETHAGRQSTILADDTFWTDLVARGFNPRRTVWFFKLDLDPVVRRPWWSFDYVVATNFFVGNLHKLPESQKVYDHSTVVATFTSPDERIEIRRVIKPPLRHFQIGTDAG